VAAGWCVFFVLAGGRYWFPRYVLPAIPPLLLLVAVAAARIGRGAPWIVAGILAACWAPFDAALVADPARAPLPPVERSQYIYDWPAGYGVAEAASALREAAARDRFVVLRDQSSGSLKEGLDLALRRGAPLEVVEAAIKVGDCADTLEWLILAGRPVVLALDQAVDRRMVLTLDGRRAVAPWAAFPKPDARRQVALYTVAGAVAGAPAMAARRASVTVDGDFGWDLAAQGRWTPAEGAFRAALSRDPSSPTALNGLGVSLWMQGRRDEALRSLAEASRRDPEDPHAGFNLSVARNAVRRGR